MISLDWSPTKEGIQWIEVELDNGDSAKGPTVDVRPAREQGFIENLFGDVNPVIGSVVALIFISIIITGLIYARKATLGKGARSEYDWDEYSSEVDYDDYDDHDDGYTGESSAPQTGQDIQPSSSSVRPQQHLALPRQKLQLRKKPTGSWALTDTGGITIRKPMNGGIKTKTARLLNSTDGV